MKPVFLIRGIDWTPRSGGIRALHILCEKLLERGEEAYLSNCQLKEGSRARIATPAVIDELVRFGNPRICIEPEISKLTLPWADFMVRWLLNAPGKAAPDVSHGWGVHDLICHFDPLFARHGSIPLFVPQVDRTIFNNKNNPMDDKRDTDCFYAKKAIFAGEKSKNQGAFDISNIQATPRMLADLFRRTRTFYTMELTACTVESALCGAKQQFIPSAYMPEPPPFEDHVARYEESEARAERDLDNFLDTCYRRLGLHQMAVA